MSAALAAIFEDHATAEGVRVRLVNDGFPTDRVDLISNRELGPAKLVPRPTVSEQLTEYFRTVFRVGAEEGKGSVALLQRAVLDGKSALIVQPRGDVEIQHAARILNEGDPLEMRGTDLKNTTLEHAATEHETPVVTWMGKVLAAAGARDTTGTARLP